MTSESFSCSATNSSLSSWKYSQYRACTVLEWPRLGARTPQPAPNQSSVFGAATQPHRTPMAGSLRCTSSGYDGAYRNRRTTSVHVCAELAISKDDTPCLTTDLGQPGYYLLRLAGQFTILVFPLF